MSCRGKVIKLTKQYRTISPQLSTQRTMPVALFFLLIHMDITLMDLCLIQPCVVYNDTCVPHDVDIDLFPHEMYCNQRKKYTVTFFLLMSLYRDQQSCFTRTCFEFRISTLLQANLTSNFRNFLQAVQENNVALFKGSVNNYVQGKCNIY